MEWKKISSSEYSAIFKKNWTIFHSAQFNELNKNKVDSVIFLYCQGKNAFYGLIAGIREEAFLSPFSSPFGGIEMGGELSKEELKEVISSLTDLLNQNNYKVRLILPPTLYSKNFVSAQKESLLSTGFSELYTDINFHFELSKNEDPISKMERNAKKNLRKGFSFEPQFFNAQSDSDKLRAYTIIQKNREEKGYPLKMSFEDLQRTSEVVQIDYYVLTFEQEDAAAAVVFQISEKVAMVVYWGHLNKFSDYRPVNLMAYFLQEKYAEMDFEILDIGPSSEFGVLNEGLASFKDSLGCTRSEKITLTLGYE